MIVLLMYGLRRLWISFVAVQFLKVSFVKLFSAYKSKLNFKSSEDIESIIVHSALYNRAELKQMSGIKTEERENKH